MKNDRDNGVLRVVVIGCGSRGTDYSELAAAQPEKFQIVAAADPVAERVDRIRGLSCNPEFKGYSDWPSLLDAAPAAELAMICTRDDEHYEVSMKAMDQGYDLLLEKPVSNSMEEVRALYRKAEELGRRVVVCHVLRYSEFYLKVKQLIDDDVLGDLVSVRASEGVGTWHFAHSFVRGHWAVLDEISSMILAKCCHDMDLLRWLIGRDCRSVASTGSLKIFRPENAPEGAPERCHQGCPAADECEYNSKLYLKEPGRHWLAMVYDRAYSAPDSEILQWLETAPWGRCAFRCDNSTVDHQVLSMDFADDISCTFTMTAFDTGRTIEIYGTKGVLKGGVFVRRSTGVDIIVENHQGETIERISFENQGGHMGGDPGLISTLHERMTDSPLEDVLAELREVVHGHQVAFSAEEARRTGAVVSLPKN